MLSSWLVIVILGCLWEAGCEARSSRQTAGGENSVEHDGCVRLMESVYKDDVRAPDPPHIVGEWVSRRCEVRSGPEFLLRKYKFTAEGRFDVHQFYYSDSSCRKPAYLLVARGTYRMGRGSFLVPGSRDMEYSMATVTVMPYTDAAADMLSAAVNASECERPSKSSSPWKPYQKYEIYSYLEVDKRVLPAEVALRSAVRDFEDVVLFDVDCTEALDFALHELQLVRLEMRGTSASRNAYQSQHSSHHQQHRTRHGFSSSSSSTDDDSTLLFLGDVHTDRKQRQIYRPSGFQEPLAAIKASNCPVCRLLADADDYYPPMLTPVAAVEPGAALAGAEWFSERCEVPPGSMATTRHVKFAADNRTWEAYQHYFADPTCRDLMFSIYSRGHLTLGPHVGDLRGTRTLDLVYNYAKITAHENRVVSVLGSQQEGACGVRPWKIGYEQDVTMTGGCPVLGLRVPHTERQIVRVERHEHELLVFMGQTPTPTGDGGFSLRAATPSDDGDNQARPTSFGLPLVKCGSLASATVHDASFSSSSSHSQQLNQQQFSFLRSAACSLSSTALFVEFIVASLLVLQLYGQR